MTTPEGIAVPGAGPPPPASIRTGTGARGWAVARTRSHGPEPATTTGVGGRPLDLLTHIGTLASSCHV